MDAINVLRKIVPHDFKTLENNLDMIKDLDHKIGKISNNIKKAQIKEIEEFANGINTINMKINENIEMIRKGVEGARDSKLIDDQQFQMIDSGMAIFKNKVSEILVARIWDPENRKGTLDNLKAEFEKQERDNKFCVLQLKMTREELKNLGSLLKETLIEAASSQSTGRHETIPGIDKEISEKLKHIEDNFGTVRKNICQEGWKYVGLLKKMNVDWKLLGRNIEVNVLGMKDVLGKVSTRFHSIVQQIQNKQVQDAAIAWNDNVEHLFKNFFDKLLFVIHAEIPNDKELKNFSEDQRQKIEEKRKTLAEDIRQALTELSEEFPHITLEQVTDERLSA